MKTSVWQWIFVVALSPLAAASDWYVDANGGNNANSGTSPSQAWRTISFAAAHVPTSGTQRIFVAAGTYDAALGETWPVMMRDKLQIVGAGPASTTLIASNVGLFRFFAPSGTTFGPDTRIEGFHLVGPGTQSGSGTAVDTYANYGSAYPTLVNLEIENWRYGVTAAVSTSGYSSPTLESVEVHDCFTGLWVLGASYLTASDSSFHDNVTSGIAILGAHGSPQPTFRRCQIEHNGSGVSASAGDYDADGYFEDCSISFNTLHGWSSPSSFTISGRNAGFLRCTIAYNGGMGIYGPDQFGFCGALSLSQSIVFGHTTDLDYQGSVTATRNDIGDGSFSGVNGNFAADPLFRNSAAGDLRLSWQSPCLDAASVAPLAGSLDLDRHARDVDGDLDTVETCDLGAFEFRPLEVVGPLTLGSLIQWELRGPAGATSVLYWSRHPLAAFPTSGPFGQYELPALTSVFRLTTIGPNSLTTLQRSIPNAPLLVGQTFSFQALTNNALAPNGKAFSDAVQITILP